MFENVGGKLKGIAKFFCILGIIGAVIGGFVVMAMDEDMAFIGLITMVVGSAGAWASSLLLYAFGQLVENSDIIAAQYMVKKVDDFTASESNEQKLEQGRATIVIDLNDHNFNDNEYMDFTCPHCLTNLAFTKAQLKDVEFVTCPECCKHINFK